MATSHNPSIITSVVTRRVGDSSHRIHLVVTVRAFFWRDLPRRLPNDAAISVKLVHPAHAGETAEIHGPPNPLRQPSMVVGPMMVHLPLEKPIAHEQPISP